MENFNTFFGKDVQISIDLLRALHHSSEFISVREFSEKFNMDRRSIYKYYSVLLATNYVQTNPDVLIEEHTKGYKFNGTRKDYKNIYREVLQENPFFNLLENLFLQQKINITKFSYENYLSETLINKRLTILKSKLADVNIGLKKMNGEVFLTGEEPTIRFFMVNFFWRTYHGEFWPFYSVTKDKCEQVIRSIYEKNRIKLIPIDLELNCYVLAVTLIRYRRGYTADISNIFLRLPKIKFFNKKSFDLLFDPKNEFRTTLAELLVSNYLLNDNEIDFLTLLFYSNPASIYINKEFSKYIDTLLAQEKQSSVLFKINYAELFNSKDFSSKFFATNEEKQKLFLSTILSGIISIELLGKTRYVLTGYNIETYIKKYYPHILKRIDLGLKSNGVYSKNEDKRNGLSLHFALAYSLIEHPVRMEKLIKIRLETDLPVVLELAIADKIKNIFQEFYNLEITSMIAVGDADFSIYTNSQSILDSSGEAVLINPQVTFSDFENLQKKLVAINRSKLHE